MFEGMYVYFFCNCDDKLCLESSVIKDHDRYLLNFVDRRYLMIKRVFYEYFRDWSFKGNSDTGVSIKYRLEMSMRY